MGDGAYGMLYTLTNHNLTFATNNAAPQMTLTTSGNVGIGVTDPDTNLEVNIQGSADTIACLLYTSPSPRDGLLSRMPSSA